MIFRVTHIAPNGRRHKGKVTARNVNDCIDQVESCYGFHRALSVICMRTRPVLHLRPTEAHFERRRWHA